MLSRLIRSMKTIPGSPDFHALVTSSSNSIRAFSLRATVLLCGLIKSNSSSFSTASMNFSVSATEILKLFILVISSLQWINSRMSG